MKFLLHGNAPNVKSGYGIQLAYLGEMLRQDGHEVAYSATYGIQGGYTNWNGFPVYGCGFEAQSNDRIHMHAGHFFRNDPGWIIILNDMWAMKNPALADFNVAAWTPIDHETDYGPQRNVLDFFQLSKAVPIAMSQFGREMLNRANLNPAYVPLTVDTSVYTPTHELEGGRDTREFLGIPQDAFLVSIVGMNKGWAKDRKGFNEAFWSFGLFDAMHPEANAYLYVHADWAGMGGGFDGGIDLKELQIASRVQPHKVIFGGGANQYGLYLGYTPETMAAVYTATDVLLAPSHGEGFCVPLIEAQACGTPAIVTDFSAQSELVPDECGWRVVHQPEWDPAHQARYGQPLIVDIVDRLVDAYKADREKMATDCIAFASNYDTRRVYENYWRPVLAELTASPIKPELAREPMPKKNAVAVLCPLFGDVDIDELISSFIATTAHDAAHLYLIDEGVSEAIVRLPSDSRTNDYVTWLPRTHGVSCAQGWNSGCEATDEPWVLCIGQDVRFQPHWLDEARKLSGEFDVIGTNDTADKPKNPFVARGIHADHFFVRRSYVDEYGACLDGPGVLAPVCYRHWYTDTEIIKLARARGVFTPCLTSVVEHLHEGYNTMTMEDRMKEDITRIPVEAQPQDQKMWMERMPLVEQQRTTRANV